MLNTDTIQVTQELLALLSEIDEFKGAWRALGTIAPERLNALRRVATIESIGSSTRIEGNKLTDREVERLLGNLDIKRFSTRDEQEVAGYAEVMETIFRAWSDIPVTENFIKQLHRDLLQYSDKDERHRGGYPPERITPMPDAIEPVQRPEPLRRVSSTDSRMGSSTDLWDHSTKSAGHCKYVEGVHRAGWIWG
jgi:Fic family protein